MMNSFVYKIQWIFSSVNEINDVYKMIRILGAKNLTAIVFRDSDLKPISKYTSMHTFSHEDASEETIKALKFYLKKNKRIFFVELYKK